MEFGLEVLGSIPRQWKSSFVIYRVGKQKCPIDKFECPAQTVRVIKRIIKIKVPYL